MLFPGFPVHIGVVSVLGQIVIGRYCILFLLIVYSRYVRVFVFLFFGGGKLEIKL